jgi:hypothetical protein
MRLLRLLVSRPVVMVVGAVLGGLGALALRATLAVPPPLVRRPEAARLSVERWMDLAAIGRAVSGYRERHAGEFPPNIGPAVMPAPLPGSEHGWELIYIPLPPDAPDHELLAYFLPFLDEPDKEPGFHALYADGQVRRVPIDEALRYACRSYSRESLAAHGPALANAVRLYAHDHGGRYPMELRTLVADGYLGSGGLPPDLRYHRPQYGAPAEVIFDRGTNRGSGLYVQLNGNVYRPETPSWGGSNAR